MSSVSLAESAALVLQYLEGSGFCKTAGTFRRYNLAVVVLISSGPSCSWQAITQNIRTASVHSALTIKKLSLQTLLQRGKKIVGINCHSTECEVTEHHPQ